MDTNELANKLISKALSYTHNRFSSQRFQEVSTLPEEHIWLHVSCRLSDRDIALINNYCLPKIVTDALTNLFVAMQWESIEYFGRYAPLDNIKINTLKRKIIDNVHGGLTGSVNGCSLRLVIGYSIHNDRLTCRFDSIFTPVLIK